jgi:ankyrin repeat protein
LFNISAEKQTIQVINSSNNKLHIEHDITENSKAFIELQKIDPLQYRLNKAILNNSSKEVREAIKAGANIHQPKIGKAPLLIAVLLKRSDAVETLLEHGATVETTHDLDDNLIQHASQLGDFKSAFLLLKHMLQNKDERLLAYKTGRFSHLLDLSLKQPGLEATSYLLKQCSRFFGKDEWVTNKKTGKKEWVLKDSFTIGKVFRSLDLIINKQKAFDIAVLLGITQYIIDHGYIINNIWNNKDEYGLIQSYLYKYHEILELFVKNGANPNHKIGDATNFTYPIFKAIASGNKEAVRVLLDNSAYINQTVNLRMCNCCSGDITPLAYATKHGNSEIIELLFAYEADM